MKILKRALVILLVLVAVLVVVGLLLPSSAHVERSLVIDASQATVFAVVNDMSQFNHWSPWAEIDPDAEYTYEGPDAGVGAKMSWKSDDPNVGSGSQEITASEPNRRVENRLDFGPQGTATGFYALEPAGEGTKITWGFDTDFGMDLMGRYFGLIFDRFLGPDFEKGLAGLKKYVESLPEAPRIEVVEVEPRRFAYVSGRTTQDEADIHAALSEAYGQVMGFFGAHGLEPAGPPLAVALEWNEEENLYAYQAGVPFTGKVTAGEGPVEVGSTYGGRAVMATHVGPYRNLAATYEALEAYLAAESLTAAGPPWEEYVSDPGETPEEELITRVYFPVAVSPPR